VSAVESAAAVNLTRLLAGGKDYLWALRQGQADLDEPHREELRRELEHEGLDATTLTALRQLEYSIARFPGPVAVRARYDQFLHLPLPAFGFSVYFDELITEHGVECGLELFPGDVECLFGHHEVQYALGGDTEWEIIHPNNTETTKRIRPGDVTAFPAGTRYKVASGEAAGGTAHAHLFLTVLGEDQGQTFYDAVAMLRMQSLGVLPAPDGALPFEDITDRVEVTDWSRLLEVDPDRERDRPTWMRNGWENREWTRALDYGEEAKVSVVSSPDREPADFIEWGSGRYRCYVNPLISEAMAAVTDCRFPAGYRRSHPYREIWAVLSGEASLRQSVPPLHAEWVEQDVASGTVLVAVNGAWVEVADASEDFVVRRLAGSCAHNGHVEMMERKLELGD
jgi:hypothetical protein